MRDWLISLVRAQTLAEMKAKHIDALTMLSVLWVMYCAYMLMMTKASATYSLFWHVIGTVIWIVCAAVIALISCGVLGVF